MSRRELGRLELIGRIEVEELSDAAAAEPMSLSHIQVYRPIGSYRELSAAGLISTRRGKRSNR